MLGHSDWNSLGPFPWILVRKCDYFHVQIKIYLYEMSFLCANIVCRYLHHLYFFSERECRAFIWMAKSFMCRFVFSDWKFRNSDVKWPRFKCDTATYWYRINVNIEHTKVVDCARLISVNVGWNLLFLITFWISKRAERERGKNEKEKKSRATKKNLATRVAAANSLMIVALWAPTF